ncbi:PPOX class probable F420-dependent enzyme [Parafrankia irregularis]|uniref:PPOX class probable F420-dependent enzyme n=1 Tax=Parafrankia irregularis TaxID=795642 RepID=A0A0S4QWU2_9ACTN|nr:MULTISPECIES: PPOX class F420-dependent oxidoreductase [Parafrankia]MBE3199998.1 PPOX class F420-dependent oxidoreductase [Parafrankia sp. CH37]CUU59256.1 PPOX class probable F420-dependent enzyme [Parafrankia irregularis]
MRLVDGLRALLDSRVFVTVSTLNADGGPHSSVVCVHRDGDDVLFSTTAGRVKARNLARDPRVSICVVDPANPLRYFEIRGTAELSEDTDRQLQQIINDRYLVEDPPPDPEGTVRLVVRVVPRKVIAFAV